MRLPQAGGDAAKPPRQHFISIQILRGLAATGVALFHVTELIGATIHAGAFGVDIFFVISGFLMVAITDDMSRPWPFLKNRLVRIVPLYWLATAALIGWWVLVSRDGAPPLSELFLSLIFLPFSSGEGQPIAPLLPLGWTLNYEMLFYLLFAATLALPPRRRLPALTALFVTAVALGGMFRPTAAPLAFWSHPMILEFLAGAWLAHFWKGGRRLSLGLALIASGVVAYLSAGTVVHLLGFPGLNVNRAPLVIPALLIVAGAMWLEPPAKSWRTRGFTLLGDASYSIYIWQFLLILLAQAVVIKLGLGSAGLFFVAMIMCVAGGLASYWLIERPLMRLFGRARQSRSDPAPISLAG